MFFGRPLVSCSDRRYSQRKVTKTTRCFEVKSLRWSTSWNIQDRMITYMRKVESRQQGLPVKRRNCRRYWWRIVGLTWWLNVWKREKTLILSGDSHDNIGVCFSFSYIQSPRGLYLEAGSQSHVTRTPLSRSEGQRSTCRGQGHIVAASRTACYSTKTQEPMPRPISSLFAVIRYACGSF